MTPQQQQQQPPPPRKQPPALDRLVNAFKSGSDFYEMAEKQLAEYYPEKQVEYDPNGQFIHIIDKYSQGDLWLKQFITVDPETVEMKKEIAKIAPTPHSVLIVGETGTGKELIANAMIARREGRFQAINCAGMPFELIESELFGHVQGAFTGALRAKDGLLVSAKDGVMFLDEIGDMPMAIQAKLLRAMQQMTVRKVGGTTDERITCKFVCATNCDLSSMVKSGTFRRDLFARVSTLEVDIKPLRDRICDIEPILLSMGEDGKKFLEKYKAQLINRELDLSLNVRSLQRHVIRYAVLGRVTML